MGVRDAVKKFFNDEKWQFEEASELKALRVGYAGKNGKFICFAKWNDKDDLFTFYAVPQLAIPKEKYSAAMEAITRANFGLPIGNFELDVDDGEIRFRAGIDAENAKLETGLVRQCVMHALNAADRYLPALTAVVEKGESPKAAIAKAESSSA